LPATVRDDSSPKFWKIMPIRRRSARKPAGDNVAEIDIVDLDLASARPFERIDQPDQRRFARARRPITPNTSPRATVRRHGVERRAAGVPE
jgi:hypothetical protein